MSIEWKEIKLEDKELIQQYYRYEQSRNCEFTFANNYLWAPHYGFKYAMISGMLVFKSHESIFSLSFPMGEGDMKSVIALLLTYFEENQKPFKLHLVTPTQFERLEEAYPGKFQIEYNRDVADYIYESEKLISLAGKKLHGKRNHINKFKETYPDWSYEKISETNKEDCLEMAKEWCKINGCSDDPEKSAEICVTLNAIKKIEELELKGGLIRAGGKVVAFSIGEEGSKDTFIVHIEKAFADIQGAYPMINQQFVENEGINYKYINREEDTGSEGLRKAKLSYYPAFLQEKGLVTLI